MHLGAMYKFDTPVNFREKTDKIHFSSTILMLSNILESLACEAGSGGFLFFLAPFSTKNLHRAKRPENVISREKRCVCASCAIKNSFCFTFLCGASPAFPLHLCLMEKS